MHNVKSKSVTKHGLHVKVLTGHRFSHAFTGRRTRIMLETVIVLRNIIYMQLYEHECNHLVSMCSGLGMCVYIYDISLSC